MVSLSILQTHEPKNLRKFISEANKNIRGQISAEIKEERKKFSEEMMKKRKMEKEKRIIQIPKGAKKEDLIKVIMDNKKHFKDIKKNVSKEDKIKELDIEIKNETPKIKNMNASELNELSKKYMNFKDLVGLDNKKHKGIVKAIFKRQQELKKPKIPTIKITEAEEETGGGAAYPKSKLGPIPKPRAKIRIVPKKTKAKLGESGLGQKRKREEGPVKKKKIIDVAVKREKPKAKIPTIVITEEEKPKRKVLKVGGRFITPKQKVVKSKLPPIPKFSGKIRLSKSKKENSEEQVFKALAELDKKIEKEKEKKKPKPKPDDVKRIPDMVKLIEKARKKGQPLKSLEFQLNELIENFDLSDFKLPEQEDKPNKKKKKKESKLQRIRRERAEAIKRDKGKVISEINDFSKNTQKEFFKYLKAENENGFTLEDQKDLFEYMEDLAVRLPKERSARTELNNFDKEQMILFNALFPKEYIQYIEVLNDITGRKEGIVLEQEKKAAKEQKLSEKKRSQEALKIEKRMKKQEEAEAKQKIKDQKEFDAYMKKNKK